MRRAYGLLGLSMMLGVGCDSSARERDEARRFLASYDALDHRDPLKQREREVEALSLLPLHVPSVQHARDACVGAHRALIAAEQAQETAALALDQALAGKVDGSGLDPKEASRVQQSILAAESALSGARTRFAPCEAEARSLALRFAER